MSIIERTNPLNLQYRICIVTSASSPLGVIICKTLLKANAFVLGVDSRPKHQSLNAGLGTHFQFLQSDASDAKTAEEIIAAAKLKFDGKERIDALVNLVGDDHGGQRVSARLSKLAGQVMASAGTGSIIYVADGDGDQRARLARAKSGNGVRCNVIHRGRDDALGAPLLAYEEAKTHMTALMRTERCVHALALPNLMIEAR